MLAPRHHINLSQFDLDGAWIANVPDLGSGSAHARALPLREVGVAVEAAVAVLRETGAPVPEFSLQAGNLCHRPQP